MLLPERKQRKPPMSDLKPGPTPAPKPVLTTAGGIFKPSILFD